MPTMRQNEALKFIYYFIRENGRSPTYAQIGKGLSTSSRGSVSRVCTQLKERGFIDWTPYKACSIRVLRPPPGEPLLVSRSVGKPSPGEWFKATYLETLEIQILIPLERS